MAIDPDQAQAIAAAYTAAWNTGRPDAVAQFFSEEVVFIINNGEPWNGKAGVADMAAGFLADIPDLALVCDGVRVSGDHVAYLWTFSGTHAGTNNPVKIVGWEEWDLDASGRIKMSRGWFDPDSYARQTTAEVRSGHA